MSALIGFDHSISYEERLNALMQSGIALWDVLHSCVRPGSLDSAIKAGTRIANDFNALLQVQPHIELVCFNGAEAEKSFNRYVLPTLSRSAICCVRLPSTSPAHAGLSFEQKLLEWRAVIDVRHII